MTVTTVTTGRLQSSTTLMVTLPVCTPAPAQRTENTTAAMAGSTVMSMGKCMEHTGMTMENTVIMARTNWTMRLPSS